MLGDSALHVVSRAPGLTLVKRHSCRASATTLALPEGITSFPPGSLRIRHAAEEGHAVREGEGESERCIGGERMNLQMRHLIILIL